MPTYLFPDIRMTEPIFTMALHMDRQWAGMECSLSSAMVAIKTCGVLNIVVHLIVLLMEAVHGAVQIAVFLVQAHGLLPGEKTLQPPIQYMPDLIMFGKAPMEGQVGHNLAHFQREQYL